MPFTNLERNAVRTSYPGMDTDIEAVKKVAEYLSLEYNSVIIGSIYARFKLGMGVDFKQTKLKDLAYFAETALGCDVRVSKENGFINVDKKIPFVKLLFGDLINSGIYSLVGYKMFLGKDKNNSPVVLDLKNARSILIAGTTGAGKSTLIRTMLASLMIRADTYPVDITIIDIKGIDYSKYRNNTKISYANEARSATQQLKHISQEINRRIETQNNGDMQFRTMVLVIDDMIYLEPNDEVQALLVNIANRGYLVGVYPIFSIQVIRKNWVSELLQSKIYTKICFYMTSNAEYRRVLGMPGDNYIDEQYSMLFLGRGKSEPIWIQGAEVSTEDQLRINAFFERL